MTETKTATDVTKEITWNTNVNWLGLITIKKSSALILNFLILSLIGGLCFYVLFVDFVDQHEKGYRYDLTTGKITKLARTGYFITPPLIVKINTFDLRPVQVCIRASINSTNSTAPDRILNCKLVRFNPDGLELFIKWHGRNPANVPEILKSYAYEGLGNTYPFLDIITEVSAQSTKEELNYDQNK
jgi:hypothetical protein